MPEISSCAIVRDDRFKNHDTGFGHPENPERLTAIHSVLDGEDFRDRLHPVPPRAATPEELGAIHTARYIEYVASTAGREHCYLDPDTHTSPLSYETALLAAGGLLSLIEKIWSGEFKNGFAFVRPPGHHAEANRAMGFCLFNNIAVGAAHLRRRLGAERVLIVDWDLHHGNGTQHSFWQDPSVLYFSIHQYPHYPGTGHYDDVGGGPGEGFNINIPVSSRTKDNVYIQAFQRLLRPVALQFKPDMVLVSAGFDAHYCDPLGGVEVTERGYRIMTRILMEIAGECCGGKLAFTLEGGYDPQALKSSVREVLEQLSKGNPSGSGADDAVADGPMVHEVERVISVHRKYWDLP